MLFQQARDPSSLILTSGASGRVNVIFSVRALRALLRVINLLVFFLLFPFRGRFSSSTAEKEEKGGCVKVRVPAKKIVPSLRGAVAAAIDQEVAARRAMAIRRVVEDKNDGKTLRDISLFGSEKGRTLFTQSWTPISQKVRLVIKLNQIKF